MFKNNKGQSALEYLMTYGWALVVIVIVIAALFAFGVFNTPKNCTQTSGLLIKDYDFNGGTIQLRIQNGTPDTITLTAFSSEHSTSWYGLGGDATTDAANGSALARTDVNTFFLQGSYTGNITEEITINYSAGGLTKTAKTTCSGPV
ncbi:MAG: hypothetical protein ABH986_02775 [archaeon]